MLNYIWISLLVIGIGVAVYNDVHDISSNRYKNGDTEDGIINFSIQPSYPLVKDSAYTCTVQLFRVRMYRELLPEEEKYADKWTDLPQKAEYIPKENKSGIIRIYVDHNAPELWKDRQKAQKGSDFLLAHVYLQVLPNSDSVKIVSLTFDPIKFVKLNQITNDGIIKSATAAVELALGLIGIMALWLGIMKVAEQGGLVALLGKALKPITTRIFPDVPADHPAMGAMIMNISANMLGLSNAATPFGLKAMEELNKLNKKVGTATDAMCTFLVINTSNVQLIPATVIAIRAASGSSNPTEILGPVIVSTGVTLIVGVTVVKLMAKLPLFKKQIED